MDTDGGTDPGSFLPAEPILLQPKALAVKSEHVYPLWIAGFWRRILADAIDALFLALLIGIAGMLFKSFFYQQGPYTRFVSFLICVTYFTCFSSEFSGGQTPGKQFMDIAVTDAHGKLLNLKKALWRSIVLFLPFFVLSPVRFSTWRDEPKLWFGTLQSPDTFSPLFLTPAYIGILASALLFAAVPSLLYGYLFNRTTHQCSHDLITGSYVVEKPASPYSAYTVPPRPQIHTNVVVGLWIVGFFLSVAIFASIRQNSLWKLYKNVNDDTHFFRVDIKVTDHAERLVLEAWSSDQCNTHECEKLASELALRAAMGYDEIARVNQLGLVIYNSIDLGPVSLERIVYKLDVDAAVWRQYAYQILVAYGNERVQKGYLKEAVEPYTHAINIQPSLWETYELRAKVYARLRQYDLALQDLHRCRELADPSEYYRIDSLIADYTAKMESAN